MFVYELWANTLVPVLAYLIGFMGQHEYIAIWDALPFTKGTWYV